MLAGDLAAGVLQVGDGLFDLGGQAHQRGIKQLVPFLLDAFAQLGNDARVLANTVLLEGQFLPQRLRLEGEPAKAIDDALALRTAALHVFVFLRIGLLQRHQRVGSAGQDVRNVVQLRALNIFQPVDQLHGAPGLVGLHAVVIDAVAARKAGQRVGLGQRIAAEYLPGGRQGGKGRCLHQQRQQQNHRQ